VTAKVGKQTKKVTITVKKAKAAVKKTAVTAVALSADNAKDPAKEVLVGTKLRAAVTPENATVTYQWKADGTAIAGATSSTFTVTTAEIGKAITVEATGTGNFEKTAVSAATAKVSAVTVANAEALIQKATVSGTTTTWETVNTTTTAYAPNVGDKLRVLYYTDTADANNTTKDTVKSDVSTSVATYQWYRVGGKDVQKNDITTAIPGATSSTYTVTKDDAGYRLQLVVTPVAGVKGMSTDANGKTKTYTLGEVSTSNVAVSIKVDNEDADTTTVGKTLAASVTPAAAASDVTYQWSVGGNDISGATSATYTPSVAGNYSVKISLKQGENTWVIGTATDSIIVKNAATKKVAITNAWNTTAYNAGAGTGVARLTNQVGDTLNVTSNDSAATAKWYLKGVTDNTTGKDVVLGNGKTLTVPASKHVNDEDVSTVGKSVYAVVTGAADDFVGTTATSKEFAITAAPSKLAKVSVKVGNDESKDLVPDTTNTVAVASGNVSASNGTTVEITPTDLPAGAKVTTDATGAKVVAGVIKIDGVKTNDNITFTVDFDGEGEAYTPVTYTVDMSKVTRA
ncbi:hypothetical protein, partial [Eubacterium pyruvativorans]|uniref:hypothetical protein n=1 Tax=Eubacterium pyruvativorans TaxID=155865 RepID=UPI000887DAAF